MRIRIRGLGNFSGKGWWSMLPGQEELNQREKGLGVRLVKRRGSRTAAGLRGGSWYNNPVYSRAVYRDSARPAGRYYVVGFRLTRKRVK